MYRSSSPAEPVEQVTIGGKTMEDREKEFS
jgi:hypothetical protein